MFDLTGHDYDNLELANIKSELNVIQNRLEGRKIRVLARKPSNLKDQGKLVKIPMEHKKNTSVLYSAYHNYSQMLQQNKKKNYKNSKYTYVICQKGLIALKTVNIFQHAILNNL